MSLVSKNTGSVILNKYSDKDNYIDSGKSKNNQHDLKFDDTDNDLVTVKNKNNSKKYNRYEKYIIQKDKTQFFLNEDDSEGK